MKTWQYELAAVALVLGLVVATSRGGWAEVLGALAVLAAFAHAQVSERMAEKQAAKATPDVVCHRWSLRYFVAKELLWLAYFVAHRSWSAIVGVVVFLAYPLWRKWWRTRRSPAARQPRWLFAHQSKVIIQGRSFDMMPKSDICLDNPWSAGLVLRLERGGCEFIAALSRSHCDVAIAFEGAIQMAGTAKVARLQFHDDASQRHVRFATLVVAGLGGLHRV